MTLLADRAPSLSRPKRPAGDARVTEIDNHYCDVAIRRWEIFTGKAAVLAETGETFEEVSERREAEGTPEITTKDAAHGGVKLNPCEEPCSEVATNEPQ